MIQAAGREEFYTEAEFLRGVPGAEAPAGVILAPPWPVSHRVALRLLAGEVLAHDFYRQKGAYRVPL